MGNETVYKAREEWNFKSLCAPPVMTAGCHDYLWLLADNNPSECKPHNDALSDDISGVHGRLEILWKYARLEYIRAQLVPGYHAYAQPKIKTSSYE